MPFDRAAALRNAEKLLRQGKLDSAIEEYVRVVEDQPSDWSTANALGDLYVRIGQPDLAIDQFVRIADHLDEQGFRPKASAVYKKILKLKPDHEHALLQAAEIALAQGLLVDGRHLLLNVLDRRRLRGDARGVAQIRVRLGSIESADVATRVAGAAARVELNDVPGAVRDLKDIAADLVEKGRGPEALDVLRQAEQLAPDDDDVRRQRVSAHAAAGELALAIECAATPELLAWLASALEQRGDVDGALQVRRKAVQLNPGDGEQRAHLARALLARGDTAGAAEYLTDTTGLDPALLLSVAEVQLRGPQAAEGVVLARRVLEADPGQREAVVRLALDVAEQAPDSAMTVCEIAADAALADQNVAAAADIFESFVARVPGHIAALMRLVEVTVDGGLEERMYGAQAQLADAYIAAGMSAQARFLAEDLAVHEPGNPANLARFRRALELDGEPDPDAAMAERLSAAQTSLVEDGTDDLPVAEPSPQAPPEARVPQPPVADVAYLHAGERHDHFDLSANAIDLESILSELEPPPPPVHAGSESVEIDLSLVLDDIGRPQPMPAHVKGDDIDSVLGHLRDEAARRSAQDVADEQYQRGLALRASGDTDGCVEALQAASRAPGLRFAAATLLGRIYRERGLTHLAVEWFERGAEAPAPTAAEGHALLYDLADVLEADGEVARALAVCLELQADAGAYRDLDDRVSRLAKLQARD